MGQSQSSSSAPPRALHVLRVTPSSPASQTSIEPFFDFVVGYDGADAISNNTVDVAQLERIVEAHENKTLNLMVWNSKSQETRVVPIVPSRTWSEDPQHTSSQLQPSLLGLSMRICEPEFALDNVWHVLDVVEGSPAESAGLVPYGDYITGWSGGVLSAENDFYDLVEAHIDKPLRVYVYSHDFDALREVVLVPNRHWGGTGLLGCVFGYGLIHRIPARPSNELEQADEYEDQNLFVPIDDPRYRRESHSDERTPIAPIRSHTGRDPFLPEAHAHDHDDMHSEPDSDNDNFNPGLPSPTPRTPIANPLYSRPSFNDNLMNASRSSTPVIRNASATSTRSEVPGHSENEGSHDERDGDSTSQGSLTSVD